MDRSPAKSETPSSLCGYYFSCFSVGSLSSLVILVTLFLGRFAHLTTASPELSLGLLLAPNATAIAWPLGCLWFLVNGGLIALLYVVVFRALRCSGWELGTFLGMAQALAAAFVYQALLELPGYIPGKFPDPGSILCPETLGFGDGRWTVVLMLFSHGLYGAIIGTWCKRSEKQL